jgi:uncharacterized protein
MLLEIGTLIILFIGACGALLPMIPGIPFMFIAALVYGFASDFSRMEPQHLWIFGGITALALMIDWSAGLIGAKFGGASRRSLLFGLVGMILGLIAFPPFGAIAGLFLGVFFSEVAGKRTGEQALKSATSSLVATAGGVVANVVLAIAFLITFVVIVFF